MVYNKASLLYIKPCMQYSHIPCILPGTPVLFRGQHRIDKEGGALRLRPLTISSSMLVRVDLTQAVVIQEDQALTERRAEVRIMYLTPPPPKSYLSPFSVL